MGNVVPQWDGPACFSNLPEAGDPVEDMVTPWYTIKVGTTAFHPGVGVAPPRAAGPLPDWRL